MCDLGHFS